MLKELLDSNIPKLEEERDSVIDRFEKWREFMHISKEDMKSIYVSKIFDKIIDKIKIVRVSLEKDILTDVDEFAIFYKESMGNVADCFNEMFDFIEAVSEDKIEVPKVDDVDSLSEKERMAHLVTLAESIFFIRFKEALFNFYEVMNQTLTPILDEGDRLFVYYFGEEAFRELERQTGVLNK